MHLPLLLLLAPFQHEAPPLHAAVPPTDETRYRCPPCGCDWCGAPSEEPGHCPACGMGLLEVGSIRNGGPASYLPDGSIGFWSDRRGAREWFRMAADGSTHRRVRLPGEFQRTPSLSPDGTRALYTGRDAAGRRQLFLHHLHEDRSEALTRSAGSGDGVEYGFPSWSPDGERLLASRSHPTVEGEPARADVVVLDERGHELRNLTGGAFGRAVEPTWSPDGGRVAFVAHLAEGPVVHVLELAGGAPVAWVAGEAPDWSPDGERLAFEITASRPYRIAVLAFEGPRLDVLTGDEAPCTYPRWSPDGRALLFASERRGRAEVWRMDADGSNARPVTEQWGAPVE